MKYCTHCGSEVLDEAVVCVKCGCSVSKKNTLSEDDSDNVLFLLLGVFIPLVGFILWLIWRDDYPNRAHNCGKGALIGVIASAALSALGFMSLLGGLFFFL